MKVRIKVIFCIGCFMFIINTGYSAILETVCNEESYCESDSIGNQNNAVYALYPTQNMWLFIKLNTRTGQMWLVQYSADDDSRFESKLNLLPLVDHDKEVNNRFILHATQNIYTFILLDQIDGNTWQVQWATDPEDRGVWPID